MASVTVLGGGHGVAAALQALRDQGHELAAVVTTADDGGSSGDLRRREGGGAVGDLRRALIALSDDRWLAAQLAERIPLGSLGRHPVGNLLIRSLVKSSGGDLQTAIDRLANRLGVRGRVICATVGEVSLIGVARGELLFGESAIGACGAPIDRIRFSPRRPAVSPAAVEAVSARGRRPPRTWVPVHERARRRRTPCAEGGAGGDTGADRVGLQPLPPAG